VKNVGTAKHYKCLYVALELVEVYPCRATWSLDGICWLAQHNYMVGHN